MATARGAFGGLFARPDRGHGATSADGRQGRIALNLINSFR